MAVKPFPLRTIQRAYCYWRWGLAKGRALITVTAGADGPFGGDRFTFCMAVAKVFGTEIALIQLRKNLLFETGFVSRWLFGERLLRVKPLPWR